MNGQSTASKEPVAFGLIEKCHRIVDEIKLATAMLQIEISEPPSSDEKLENVIIPPLEQELNRLVKHLQSLLQSYKV